MKLNAIIIDDEPLARKLLIDFAEKVTFLEVVASFSNGLGALDYLKDGKADLVFLDIQMPDITGLELLKTLPNRPRVIFTTAYAEHAVEGFELDAIDYLLKPFSFPRFLKAVNKAFEMYSRDRVVMTSSSEKVEDFIFIKDGRELVKVLFKDIRYIQGQKDYVMFHTSTQKLMSLMNMRDLETDLPEDQFLRIHQSYIINKGHIESIASDKVQIDGEYFSVSQSYKQAFKAFLSQYKY